jgi:hypothetical protein
VLAEVVNVVWIWKIYWPLVLDVPLSVRVVERTALLVGKSYTPGARVKPPRSVTESVAVGTSPKASLYAVRIAASACKLKS